MTRIELITILKDSGQDELNATKIGSAIYDAIQGYSPDHLATKEDIANTKIELIDRISEVKSDLTKQVISIKTNLSALLIAGLTLSTTILGLLITFHK